MLPVTLSGCFFGTLRHEPAPLEVRVPLTPLGVAAVAEASASSPATTFAVPSSAAASVPAASTAGTTAAAEKGPPASAPPPAPNAVGTSAAPPADSAATPRQTAAAPAAARQPDDAAALPLPNVVYFDLDVFKVDERYRPLLQAHAAKLKRDPSRQLLVSGHIDSLGPRDYNRALAKKRAEMVARMLKAMGVSSAQLELAVVDDKAMPADDGSQADSANGRRVELLYGGGSGAAVTGGSLE